MPTRPTFEARCERAARLCDRGPHARIHTPLWLFLDGLTRAMLGGSNLPKIGWSLGEALGAPPDWYGEHDAASGIWWFRDGASGNLFIHGCHPKAARRGHLSDAALDRTALLARNSLPHFA